LRALVGRRWLHLFGHGEHDEALAEPVGPVEPDHDEASRSGRIVDAHHHVGRAPSLIDVGAYKDDVVAAGHNIGGDRADESRRAPPSVRGHAGDPGGHSAQRVVDRPCGIAVDHHRPSV
jgi:hypothetical protein